MEPSSIVSFNNESTLKPDYSVSGDMKDVNVHELALHAMRDRCLLLQRRINSLENDNMRLKLVGANCEPYHTLEDDERHQLRLQLADLAKQKSQLMHHVFMVTCENKNLWNRLAALKNTPKRDISHSNFIPIENTPQKQAKLLRTNTYIQSSTPKVDVSQEKYSDISLEEISLKLINSYIQEKSQLVEECEQMAEMQSVDDCLNLDSIVFAYVDDASTDSLKELRTQTEKLAQLKEEVSKQEEQLMAVLSNFEKLLNNQKCSNCTGKPANQVSTENKEIETSDSLGEWATPAHSNTYQEENIISEININTHSVSQKETTAQMDQPEMTTDVDKVCPMCGKTFRKECSFDQFQQHVESHFIGEPEPDSIDFEIGRNAETNDFI